MTKKMGTTSSPASVRAKLLQLARARGDDFQIVLEKQGVHQNLWR